MHETIFVKRPKFLAATPNLRVEQNLVHLGRFLHFSQKVVGVTLKEDLVNNGYSLFAEEVISKSQYEEDFIKSFQFSLVTILSRF